MKKLLTNIIFLLFFLLIGLFIVLSTIGIKTEKFNNFVSKKINQNNQNLNLYLKKIKFKLDVNELSLFLQTADSIINYRDVTIPTDEIKVYIDFFSLLSSKPQIKKVKVIINPLNIDEVKKISLVMKPSNLTSIIRNKILSGNLTSEFEIFLDKENQIENFITKGSVSSLNMDITKNIQFKKAKFNFFADKSDVLIKNIYGEVDNIKIIDGDIKLLFTSDIKLNSNFTSKVKLNKKNLKPLLKKLNELEYFKDLTSLDAELNNSLSVNFDNTFKLKNYEFDSKGKVDKAIFNLKKPIKNTFNNEDIKYLFFNNLTLNLFSSPNKKKSLVEGKYSLNDESLLPFKLNIEKIKDLLKIKINADYQKLINLKLVNYYKKEKDISNVQIDLESKKKDINIKTFKLSENKNFISIDNLKLKNSKLISFKKVFIKTYKDGVINNDFTIIFDKKIKINGNKFDATNISRLLKNKSQRNNFKYINKEIEIDLKNIKVPLSEELSDFKLIGLINKGKFVKITSKGDFGDKNFLDISMKNNEENKKQYLEVYSDLPQPLLNDYSFFKGLSGGKLLFTSIIEENLSNSKLIIENFKIVNAPGVVKLLSLADLSGLADLAEGEGLSFDKLEINMKSEKGFLTLDEIFALGPSISVLMEGYQDQKGLTSLRGTLVPAKNLNRIISKIPVIGDIVIPKEVGEGLFGISFKMKGPPGKIKTTINPIRTLTPRFIQKIIERENKSK